MVTEVEVLSDQSVRKMNIDFYAILGIHVILYELFIRLQNESKHVACDVNKADLELVALKLDLEVLIKQGDCMRPNEYLGFSFFSDKADFSAFVFA